MIYDFHPAAKQELNDTVNYYDNINPDLGDAFLDEFDRTLERIQRFPKAWSLLSANTRYCRMGRFPYSIIYRIQEEETLLIVAVMHWQRKPLYWQNRL
ncbi:type II toxin-antitoxin system RelE/ParE family toxin [Laspinema sp. D1]|uniref:type II toxin-antitoxin system RelE/ParE family toxin n=1 Tax=Laspinema palackyanum TaxID=3231601 RepID=UPI003496FFD2|nr:type II toxin-antitoxin system RelE/ParE family toxin [Laspinema sp. D2b]